MFNFIKKAWNNLTVRAVECVQAGYAKVKALVLTAFVSMLGFGAMAANATAPDFSTLTAAVDFSTVITAILLVMAGLAGVYIIWVGGGMILTKLKAGK